MIIATDAYCNEFVIPDAYFIETLTVGCLALDFGGRWREVDEIHARKEDVNGDLFACYYVKWSENSRVSGSLKAGKLHRNTVLSRYYNSAELDAIEQLLLN